MVAPIVGPFTTVLSMRNPSHGGVDLQRTQTRYRQKRPIDQPLPYDTRYAYARKRVGAPETTVSPFSADLATYVEWNSAHYNGLKIIAYDRLKGQISESAQLGVGLIETRKSVDMISKRATQLWTAARALRRLDFARVNQALNLRGDPPRKAVKKAKASDFGGAWLEYSFGWAPTVADIGNAIQVLQEPLKDVRIRAKAKGTGYTITDSWPPSYWGQGKKWTITDTALAYGVDVAITNPNLYLANKLGFVNPAQIVWELIPFSFVVDWFVNVEQFLGTGTDFLGLSQKNPYTTYFMRGKCLAQWGAGYAGSYSEFDVIRMWRGLGLSQPNLALRPWKIWGWQRALNASALLTLALKSF